MATVDAPPQTKKPHESTTALLLIGVFKLVKGVLLLAVGIGAIKLLHRDIAETVMHWVDVLRVDPDGRFSHGLLARVLGVSPNQLKALSVGTFIYSSLLLTEGTGLLLRKRWAEYFTVITTGLLLPLEIYEIVERLSSMKVVVLIVNVAIVVYLVVRIVGSRHGNALVQD